MLGCEANEDFAVKRDLVRIIYKRVQNKELSPAELALLKYWDAIWQEHEKDAETQQGLEGILWLLANPELKNIEFQFEPGFGAPLQSSFVRLFADPMSLKEITQILFKMIKVRLQEAPALKSIIKGITNEENKAETQTFQVKLAEGALGNIGFKRKRVSSIDRSARHSIPSGHVVAWTSNAYGSDMPNIYQSVKAAICEGSFSRNPLQIRVSAPNFRYPVYQSKQSFNIMLVLDVSNSVKWILQFMGKIISLLTAQASAAKDKLGLVIFQHDQAQIIHYPTINVRHVVGTINTLSPKGKTPLAEGLKMALQTLEQSRFQLAGMENAIVLLSDCFPEPITGEYEDQLEEPASQAILQICDKIAEAKIKFLVINPSLNSTKNYEKHLGYRLGNLAAKRAKGRFLNLRANLQDSYKENEKNYVLSEQTLKKFAQEIGEFRMDGSF